MNATPILELTNVCKSFQASAGEITIFNDISIRINRGEKVAIIGPSGSGKSTLLSLIGLLDTPTSGEIAIEGMSVKEMDENKKAELRNKTIGFVFQSFELISPFSVEENVSAPLEISGKKVPKEEIAVLLEEVGLTKRAEALPYTLSGGEKQRVAIARALINNPSLLLADEPTGSLDRDTGERVLQLLLDAVDHRDTTLIIITHDESIADRMDRVFEIKNQTLHERK